MNHTYRLIWNDTQGAYVAAPENARARGKRNALKLAAAAVLTGAAFAAHALPTGGQISAGAGSIGQSGSTTTINQTSQNLAVNWQGFDVGANERVNFVQPNASAIALNRVLGSDPSLILGQLNANGQVWLLNPNGLLFGSSAQVNTGGLVASTLGISDADFMAGKRSFTLPSPASGRGAGGEGRVINRGTITAADGGYVALLGGQVSNEGVITARLGTVALAAGNQVTLDFSGDQLLGVQVDKGALDALAQNKQLIRADGGTVLMTAQAADALAAAVVNNTGVIEARSIENHNGVIKLLGDMQSGTVNVGGTLDASASVPSPSGGGLGWGSASNGGFIETSAAHVKIADGAKVTTLAANGKSGTWLIDPVDFTIASGSGALTISGIGADTLSANLGGGDIAIATDASTGGNGDIFVNSAVSWSAHKLTLTAHRNININANLNGSGTAQLALEYGQVAVALNNTSDYTLSNGAQINLPAGANFSTKLGNDVVATTYTVITALGGQASSGDGTLQGMVGGLGGNYVLGGNIDASATGNGAWLAAGGFTPVGSDTFCGSCFTGKFDGLGHTISGLTINRDVNAPVGLFGSTNNATLQNVGLLNLNLYGGTDGTGALAGRVQGTSVIRNSYADGGSVRARSHNVGGLVGFNSGSISYSYANVSVESSDGGFVTDAYAGGLVGINNGSISYSYATGSVTGNAATPAFNKYIGGLVGRQNAGSISNSYATGAVSGNSFLGGLVGNWGGGSAPTGSYWDKTTTGQNNAYSGGVTTGGLATTEWATLGPFGSSPSNGAWSATDWGAGNPYPGIKALPYITITASASQTYGSAAAISIASILDQTGANASSLVNTGSLVWQSGTSTASAAGTTGNVRGAGATRTGYQILYTGSLTVDQAPLTVTANAASKTYDGTAYSGGNGVGYSGFVNGDSSAALGGALSYGGSAQGAKNAGSYAIIPAGLTAGNYAITFANGTLTINPAAIALGAGNKSKTYGGIDPVLTWHLSSGNLAAGDSVSGSPARDAGENAGSYAIRQGSLTIGGNYVISFTNGSLTIAPAPLTVTASNAAKTYDGLAYSGGWGVSYSGFVNSETSSVLGGALAYGGASQGATNAGSYAITPLGLASSNYAITYTDGALTVGKANLMATANAASKTYNGLAYSGGNGVSYSGFVNNETSAALGGTLAYGGTSQGATNAGSYAIKPSGLTSGNYAIGYADGALTVGKANLTATANAASKTYNGLAYSGGNGVSYSGFVNNETSAVLGGTLAYGGTSQGATNAGGYAITPSGLTSGNYAISYADGALTVNKAPLAITALDDTKIYDALPYTGGNGITYSGFVNGETSAVLGGAPAYGGSSQGATNVGGYVITPSGLTSGNYMIAYNDGVLDIGARVPAITGAPTDGYTGAIANVVAGASTITVGSVAAGAGGYAGAGTPVLSVDYGGSAAGGGEAGAGGASAGAASGGGAGAGAAGGGGAGAGAVASAEGTGAADGGDDTSPDERDAATAESFATEYDLVTHGCGQRLPAGLSCR